jgi:hypothetical protein
MVRRMKGLFLTLGLISLLLTAFSLVKGESPGLSKVVFIVSWYDVGKAALEGLRGVKKVERGFKGKMEINTVYYDPGLISVPEMEAALRQAGTYLGTEKN